jgi:hypothetical protein
MGYPYSFQFQTGGKNMAAPKTAKKAPAKKPAAKKAPAKKCCGCKKG